MLNRFRGLLYRGPDLIHTNLLGQRHEKKQSWREGPYVAVHVSRHAVGPVLCPPPSPTETNAMPRATAAPPSPRSTKPKPTPTCSAMLPLAPSCKQPVQCHLFLCSCGPGNRQLCKGANLAYLGKVRPGSMGPAFLPRCQNLSPRASAKSLACAACLNI